MHIVMKDRGARGLSRCAGEGCSAFCRHSTGRINWPSSCRLACASGSPPVAVSSAPPATRCQGRRNGAQLVQCVRPSERSLVRRQWGWAALARAVHLLVIRVLVLFLDHHWRLRSKPCLLYSPGYESPGRAHVIRSQTKERPLRAQKVHLVRVRVRAVRCRRRRRLDALEPPAADCPCY
jgi:hypothetical protein